MRFQPVKDRASTADNSVVALYANVEELNVYNAVFVGQ